MAPTSIKKTSGFTLVELVIVVPIAMLTLMAVVAVLINLVADNASVRGELSAMHDTQQALNTIETDASLAAKFITTKDAPFNDPYGPSGNGGSWSFNGSSSDINALLIRAYATTANPLDTTKTAVYINELGCSNDVILSNPALTTNILYFVQGGNLYRRVLTDTSKTTCAPQYQKQSCPPNRTTNNTICKTDDSLLLSDVTKFKVDYFSDPLSGTPLNTSSGAASVLDPAVAVRVTIKVSKSIAGQAFIHERSLFIHKRNL
ncbi:MAG TPA: hypothetical protein VD907_01065 [Verrucomicrobiae bacterium]|nr:hypothetical protein [Verrucomicrobiae bacterium]